MAAHRKSDEFRLDAVLDGHPDLPTLFTSYLQDLVAALDDLHAAMAQF